MRDFGMTPRRSFSYVRVPADASLSLEELQAVIGDAASIGDALPNIVKIKFIGGGAIDEGKARAEAAKQLGKAVQEGFRLTPGFEQLTPRFAFLHFQGLSEAFSS